MALQEQGRAEDLRALLDAEEARGPALLRLGDALSVLYPPGTREKRLLDGVIRARGR
jgi:hypothetical protein